LRLDINSNVKVAVTSIEYEVYGVQQKVKKQAAYFNGHVEEMY